MPTIEQEMMDKLLSLRGKVKPDGMDTLDELIELEKQRAHEKKRMDIGRPKRRLRDWVQVPEGFYTVKDVADRFGVSKQSVYKWLEQGKIQAVSMVPGSTGQLIPKAQFKPDEEEQQRSKLRKLRERMTGGAGQFEVDEEEFPVEQRE